MARTQHRQGKKFTKGHTTVIDQALEVVDALAELPTVKRISIGVIDRTKTTGNGRRITTNVLTSGLKMKVRGNRYIQTFYVYTSDVEEVLNFLDKLQGSV